MDTILTIISMVLVITALILCARALKEAISIWKPQPRTVEMEVMERLERAVAALENELFGAAEEAAPKEEAPKLEHDTTMSGEYLRKWGWMYRAECSACDWWHDSYSPQTAVEKGVDHEGRHV